MADTRPLDKVVFFSRHWAHDLGRLARETVRFDLDQPQGFAAAMAGAELVIEVEANDGRSHYEGFASRAPCPTALWLIDTHLVEARHRAILPHYSHVFVAIRHHARRLARLHPRVRWLPLCNTKPLLTPTETPPRYDLAFVGNEFSGHHRRSRLLDRLQERLGPRLFRGTAQGEDYLRTLQSARLAFNHSVNGEDTNFRVFEALAAGCCLLTDRTPDIAQLFRDREQLVCYEDEASLFAALDHYLADPEARARVAAAGRAEVLAKHQARHRLLEIVNVAAGRRFGESDF